MEKVTLYKSQGKWFKTEADAKEWEQRVASAKEDTAMTISCLLDTGIDIAFKDSMYDPKTTKKINFPIEGDRFRDFKERKDEFFEFYDSLTPDQQISFAKGMSFGTEKINEYLFEEGEYISMTSQLGTKYKGSEKIAEDLNWLKEKSVDKPETSRRLL
tara:strand:+ start:917 stop:1390 length:474 start_codon:yes stop_codon:yes gene_type:complete